MRNLTNWILPCLLLAGCSLLLIQACSKAAASKTKTVSYTYSIQTPVFHQKQDILDSINGNSSEPIDSVGKIYIKDNLIFLNDVDKGIHVINNSNPANPVQTAFLKIPGNQDIVIKGNMLYADMFDQLLAIDISDIHHVQVNSMLPSVFTERGYEIDSTQVFVGFISRDTTVTYQVSEGGRGMPEPALFFAASSTANSSSQTGVSGSTARMTLINNYIYAITERHTLGTIDISNATTPTLVSSFFAGYDLETIFPFKNSLFLGSDIGTFIYDISNPANPVQSSKFNHGTACDPVITDGTNAYITLHAGSACGGASNELDVVNVQNLNAPTFVKSYQMISPTGLSKDGNTLFVCDGANEVKVFDAANPANIRMYSFLTVSGPHDLIAANNILLVVADAGLYQYNYSNPKNINFLSKIAVK